MRMRPKRRKGTERVVIWPGTTSLITMTLAGSAGISLEADLEVIFGGSGRQLKFGATFRCSRLRWDLAVDSYL